MHRGILDPPAEPEKCGKIYGGERMNVLEDGMKEIAFQDKMMRMASFPCQPARISKNAGGIKFGSGVTTDS